MIDFRPALLTIPEFVCLSIMDLAHGHMRAGPAVILNGSPGCHRQDIATIERSGIGSVIGTDILVSGNGWKDSRLLPMDLGSVELELHTGARTRMDWIRDWF